MILLLCIFLGCGQQGREYGAKNNELQLQVENKEQKVKAKEQAKIQPKKETKQTKANNLSKKEKKKIEKRVLELVDRLEKLCIRHQDIKLKDAIREKGKKEAKEIVKELKELKEIGKGCVPILINGIKDTRRDLRIRIALIHIVVD
ncbi:MAG: hypothetical protein AB1567_08000 [bacterium]